MPTNRSVWQDKPGVPGVIRESMTPTELDAEKLLVKVHTWAINPCDPLLQDQSLPFIKYPLVLGEDIAGTVEAVGSTAASKFKVGDRVFAFTATKGFQEYVTVDHTLAAKIPKGLSFSEAVVFPLCTTTSATGLFAKDFLGLPFPSLNPVSTGKSILIWGGSSAVGSNAIQFTKAAGFEVFTTCSPRSFDYVKGLGADKVFDYNSPTAIDDIVAELDKTTCAGIYLAVGSVASACQVSYKSKQKLFVASSNPILPGDAPEGVDARAVGPTDVESLQYTLPVTFGGYLVEALEKGVYKVAPPPEVVSRKGIEGIQDALDIFKKGVSAKKLVVEVE